MIWIWVFVFIKQSYVKFQLLWIWFGKRNLNGESCFQAEDTALKTALIPSGRIREERVLQCRIFPIRNLWPEGNGRWSLKAKVIIIAFIKPLPPDRKYNHCFIKAYFKNWHSCTRLGILIIWTFESIILFTGKSEW